MAQGPVDLIRKLKKIKKKNIYKCVIIVLFLLLLDILGVFAYLNEYHFDEYFQYPVYGNVYSLIFNLRHKRHYLTVPINTYKYNYRILNKCEKIENEHPGIILLIRSALPNAEKRIAIRSTWGYEKPMPNITIRRLFLMGTTPDSTLMSNVAREAKQYNDILQVNKLDNRLNNTLAGMHWALRRCNSSAYYLFADDNYYISIRNILQFISLPASYPENLSVLDSTQRIKEHGEYDRLYAGFVYRDRPVRQKYSKWYVNMNDYPYNAWPPYMKDGAFIIARDALLDLYHASLYTQLLQFDDIYFGIVAMKGRVKLTHTNHFYFTPPKYTGPNSYSDVLASNGFDSTQDMVHIWKKCHVANFA